MLLGASCGWPFPAFAVRHEAETFFQQCLLLVDDLFLIGPRADRLRLEVGERSG